jgi:two-component system OmpR family sensor kinase
MSSSRPTERIRRAARRLLPRSLTSRIVVTNIVLVAVASLVVTIVSTLALRQFLLQRLDDQVQGAAVRSQIAFAAGHTGPPPGHPGGSPTDPDSGFLPGQGPGTLSGSLDNPDEPPRIISDVVKNHEPQYAAIDGQSIKALALVPVDGTPHTVALGDKGRYRVIVENVGGDRIVSGLPTKDVDATIHRLIGWETLVALLSVLLTALACLLLVRRQLRPLHLVASTAQRVSALQLETGQVSLTDRVPDSVTDPATEVGQVGAALNTLLGRVEEALQARHQSELRVRQFVADASHELRTPLSTIRGYAELSRRGDPADSAGMLRSLSRVESESERMATLVDDLLLLARLDSGRPLKNEEVDVTRVAVETVSDARVVSPDHSYRLQLPDQPLLVAGDEQRLRQVLTNLLANAGTHSGSGSTITVSARPEPVSGVVEIRVHDDGPGLPTDLTGAVFERFSRADTSRTRASGGAGLGLSIVKAIVVAHGGRVSVQSGPGSTTFTVVLPNAHSAVTD